MQKKGKKKTISGAIAVAAGAAAITGGVAIATTQTAHAQTPQTVVSAKANSSTEKQADTSESVSNAGSDVSGIQQSTEKESENSKKENTAEASTTVQAKDDAVKTESKENAEEKSSTENVTAVQAESNVKEAETADPANVSASTAESEELSVSAPSVTEKTEKISDKTEEKADEKGGNTKTRTEVYQHEKTTVTKSEGVPDEAEKQANKDEKGNEPVKKHVTETEKETWTETKTTTETTTKKASGDTQMTNADDYSQKSVYQIGSDGSAQKSDDNVSEKVKDFYDSQNITSDFAVYAGSLDGTIGHEDGNIAVDELNAGTTIMNKDGQYAMGSGLSLQDVGKAYANSGYSYINKTKDDQYINSSSNFQTGGTNDALVIYGPDEGNSHEDTDGTANHFRSVHTKKEKRSLKRIRSVQQLLSRP